MTYALLRIFYGLWFVGALGFMALTIGTTAFSTRGWRQRAKTFFRRMVHACIWPIALLSAKGRKALLTDIEDGQ
jgi:hypothetical protein